MRQILSCKHLNFVCFWVKVKVFFFGGRGHLVETSSKMALVQGTSTASKEAIRRTQLLADSFFSENSTIQLVTGLDQRLSVNINRNLLLFHSPLLRSIISSSNSNVLFVPDASLPSLVDLEMLLKTGVAKLRHGTRAEDIKDSARILGISLDKLSLANTNIHPNQETNLKASDKSSVSVETKEQIEAKNGIKEAIVGISAGLPLEKVVKAEEEIDFQRSLEEILGDERIQDERDDQERESDEAESAALESESGRDEPAGPEGESGREEPEFSCQIPGQRCTGKDFRSLRTLRVHYSQHFRSRLKTVFAGKMIGDECYRCKKKFANKDRMVIHIGAEHKKVDKILREEKGIVLENALSPENSPTSPAKTSIQRKERLVSSVLCNFDTKCEVCGKEVGSSVYMPVHVSGHFLEELKRRFHKFTNNLDCKLCGIGQGSIKALYRHIGVQHLKVNEILLEKGFRILPSAITYKQDEKQEHLMRIKKESNENFADIMENMDESQGDENEGAKTKDEPKIYSFTDINTLYPQINMRVS